MPNNTVKLAQRSPNSGIVYLVGAGPGDPGLITLKGYRCLHSADLILYDALVNPLLLADTRAQAVRISRQASADGLRLPQAEINARLIAAAREGQTVVRLKGGDPFVFGRGGEEAAALAAAGVRYEVVPGVTAAVAASAYAGISLTHRDFASGVAFITGHEDPTKPETALDYQALTAFPGTLVFYMGLNHLSQIAEKLISCGKDPATPAAVICRGTTPAQQTVTAALSNIAESAHQAGLHAPSTIVIGECVRQRDKIAWFERLPLFGLRVGVTRPRAQCGPVVERLLEQGAQPIVMPTIDILPPDDWADVDRVLAKLHEFDWLVFTSVNGVQSLVARLWETGGDLRRLASTKVAAIGAETAAALESLHLRADVVPDAYRAEALAAALGPHVRGRRVLWARASRGRDVLATELRAAGAEVVEVAVYRNVDVEAFDPSVAAALEAGEVDWVGLSSPSVARSFARLLPAAARAHLGRTIRLASISPVTTAAAVEAGLPIAAEAREFTWAGIIEAVRSGV
ncbi:MAG: uroporphyrinogen-III C-methyltransferase [Planctomycetaceae bacterium]